MIKRLSFILIVLSVVSKTFAYDFASSDTAGAIYYNLDNKNSEATVVAGEWQYSGDVVIPSSITVGGKDYLVTTIGKDAFYYCYDVKSVTLGSNVKTIKTYAFERVSGPNGSGIKINLDSDALTTIEANAFHCAVLKPNKGDTLAIGKNVTGRTGRDNFFSWTTFPGVKHFYVDESSSTLCTSADGILYSKDMKKLYYFPPYLDSTTYDIPASVETVSTYAFYAMQVLQTITGGDNVTSMGSVLSGKVTSLHIGAKVSSMSTDALMYAAEGFLPVIDENNKWFELIDGALYNYSGSDTILCRYFKCNKQETFVVPANVNKIGSYAFYNHQYIKNIDYGLCTKLKSGNIASTAYHSTKYSVKFQNAENIYVNIDGVFYSDDTVTMVIYGSDVTLKDYVMPKKTTTITVSTIKSNANTKTFSINKAANSINGEYLYPLENLEYYYVDEGNGTYSSDTCGVLYNKAKTKLISYPRGNKRLFYKVADGTKQVGVHAFYYNKYLQGLDLGNDITSVIEGNSGNMAYMQSLSFIRVGTNQPPTATTSSFSSSMYSGDTKVILYVPKDAFDIYNNSSIWNRFAVVRDTGQFMSDIKSKKYDYLTYHYKQNIEGTGFLEPESVKCEGYLLCNTTAEPNNYEGFTPMPFDQKLLDNTNIIVKIYYTRNSYTVNWKSKDEVVSNGTYKYGTVMTAPNVTVTPDAGKHFIGWNSNPDATTAVTFDENSLLRKDTTFYAIFATNDRKPYVVRHFLQNLDDNNYPTTPYATDTIMEVFGLQTQATAKTYTGFTAPASINQETVSEDGNTVVDINYTRNSYDVNWYNGSAPVLTGNYKYGSELVIPSDPSAVAGKHFVGWNTDANATVALSLGGKTVEGAATYYAIFATNDSKSYTVNHYKQNLDGTYPTDPEETETGSGTVGLQTQATAKTYTGFTAPETISQEIIKADGTTVVDIKYTRNSYDVKWYNGSASVLTGNYKYGSALEIPADQKAEAGKHFVGWNTNASATSALTLTDATVESAVTYYAIFVDNDNKSYVVNHYQEGLDGNYPATPTTTDNGSGVWGLQTDASAKNYEGFTAQNFSQATIKEDGTTVVEIYYKRNIHILTWSIGYGTLESESYTKGSVMFGATIIEPKLNREGYTHKGWSLTNGGNTTVVATQMPDADLTYYDVWDVNEYKVIWDWNYAGSPQPTSFFNYGEDIEAPAGVPDRDKYTFAGWSKTKNGAIITNGDFGKMTTAGATFYAQWIPNKYNLTWNANGGSLSGSYTSGSVDYGTDIVKPNASRTGYTFIGWGESATATSTINIPLTMPGEDKEFFAIWKINQHTLTWNANSGELSGDYTKGTVTYGTTITAPSAFRYGYTFKGWTTTLGSTETVEITTMPDSDVVYYAVWEANKHNLVWDANGGELGGTYTSGSVAYGTAIVAPTEYSKTGFKFAGWGESATSTTPTSVASTMPDADVKYYALWVANDYVVEWLLNDGTGNLYGSNNVTYGNAISKIEPDPTREYYQFLGWSKTEDGVVITDFGTMNANEVKFYAQWQINSNNLSWDANGGDLSGIYTSGAVDYGKEIVKPTATRKGHTFEGWASASDASVSDIVEITTMPDADTTFYAVWSVNAYTVNWKLNDGYNTNFFSSSFDFGSTIEKPATDPSFEHHTFMGWSSTADGDVISEFGTMQADDTTFYAVWSLDKHVAVWYANNGTNDTINVDTLEYDAVISVPDSIPTREHYTFEGWSSTADGGVISNYGTMQDADTAFYAVWALNENSVLWYVNDGTEEYVSSKFEYGAEITSPVENPSREHYTFEGWSATADGDVVSEFGTMPDKDTAFYAVWALNKHVAVWYANNGTNDTINVDTLEYDAVIPVPDSMPSREHYTFVGWSAKVDGTAETSFGTMPDKDTAFYAVWTLNKHVAVWYANNGTNDTVATDTLIYGESISAPATNPTRAYCTFEGWSATANGLVTTDFGTMPDSDTAFYAVWTLNEKIVVWYANDGTNDTVATDTLVFDATINAPAINPTREHYTFKGWSATADGEILSEFGTMPDKDTAFYAVWEINRHVANWYANDGTDAIVNSDTLDYGTVLTAPKNILSRENYQFNGWSATTDGDTTSLFGTMPDNDTAFYAVWESLMFDAVWYANNGTAEVFFTTHATVSTTLTAPATNPVRDNFTFKGWSATADGEILDNFGVMPLGGTQFYAVWEDVLYDAVWYANNGTAEIFFTTHATVSTTLTAPATNPTRDNFTFKGWSSTADGEVTTSFGVMPAGGTQFYAVWEDVLYDAVWYANNGTAEIFFTTHATVSSTLTAPEGTPDHGSYIFKGWSSTADGEPLTDFGIMPAGGTSFYAVWAPGEFTVVWDMNDGSGKTFMSQQVVLGEKIVAPVDNPSRKCYEFKGWSATADGDVTTDFGVMTADGAVFYAIWAGIVEFTAPESFETCENEKYVELTNVSDSVKFVWKVNGVVEPSQVGTIFTLPDNAKFSGTITVTGSFGGTEVTKEIKYIRKKDMITTMWDDVVSVINTDNMFQSYKWYHNDALIDTTEYYNEVGGLTGKYYLVATTSDGEEICSCERDFGKKPEVSISVYPNPAVERVLVKGTALEVGKSIIITDENGKVWLSREITDNDVEDINLLNLPQGLYIVKIDNKSISFIKL